MSAIVEPLDPASPEGIETAARISEALGEILAAIWRREAVPPRPRPEPTPRPTPPPPRPTGPPSRFQAA